MPWPDIPACYGWLSLDRRGQWRLKGERVLHPGFVAYLNRHYGAGDAGAWVVRNGPQTVFVRLDYTPIVWRLMPDGMLVTHTGVDGGFPTAAWLDQEGNILLEGGMGIGLLDDRDLAGFLAECVDARAGAPVTDPDNQDLTWRTLVIRRISAASVPGRFGFDPDPQP